ncbi:BA14K family protein, partial [Mesorhizobium sp. M00.F.Ca.ET.158.01.1.1]
AEVSYVSGDAASAATTGLSADHVDSCFSRYRSYRPEDNSYQPYSGGPRRQCE